MSGPNYNVTTLVPSRIATAAVEVYSADDFPAPSAGVITLAANTQYILKNSFTMSDRFEIPSESISEIMGSTRTEILTFSGTGALFTSAAGSTAQTGELTIRAKITSTSTGSLLDIDGHGLLVEDTFITGFDEIGTAKNTAPVIVRFCRFINSGGGFKFIDCQAVNFLSMLFNNPGGSHNEAHITVVGTSTTINAALDNWTRQSGETAIWIDPSNTANAIIIGINAFGGTGAGFFQKNGTAAITAFADAGGGLTTVTSNAHGLSNGQGVRITGTTSYNGGFVISGVTANTFNIERAFVANDATGTWNANSRDEKAIGTLVESCAGQKDSAAIGSGGIGGNATVTVISTQNVFVDLALNANFAAASNIERFTVTNTTTGEIRYDGDEPFDGVLSGIVAASSTGGNQRFNFQLLKNGAAIPAADDIDVPIEVGSSLSASPLLWPIELVQNDLLRLQVANADGTSNITIDTLKLEVQ